MNTFKTVSWESIKLLFVIAFIAILFANFLFLTEINEIKRGQDAIYDAINVNHQEVKQIILEK